MKLSLKTLSYFAVPSISLLVIGLSGSSRAADGFTGGRTGGRTSGGGNSGGGNSGGGLGHRGGGGSSGGGLGHRGGGGSSGGGESHHQVFGGGSSQSSHESGGLGHRGGGGFGSPGNNSGSSNSSASSQSYTLGRRGSSGTTIIEAQPRFPFRNVAPPPNQWSPKIGLSHYPGNNNLFRPRAINPVRIASIPMYSHPVNSLPTLVLRQSHVTVRSPYRVGYYGYGYYPGWNDSYFFYPNYVFSPYNDPCLISPWYYYSMLPGYISTNGCTYGYVPFFNQWPGSVYYWNQGGNWINNLSTPYGNDNQQPVKSLDTALEEIQDAFEHRDIRNLLDVTNPDLEVPIFINGQYQYSLDGQDFYGLMRDNIMDVNTDQYTILDVRRNGYQARVLAEQDFYDAWGQFQRVYQEFIIDFAGSQPIITQFGTSQNRPW